MRVSIALLLMLLLSSLLPFGFSADSQFLASTFLGGGGDDSYYVASVAVDAEGNIYVAGDTASDDFPTTEGALDTTFNGGKDIFVSKFDPGLTRLLASTYLGGGGEEFGCELVIDVDGNIIVAGQTYSTDFPTTEGAFDGSHNGNRDVFVSRLSGDLTALLASTYLGGSGGDTVFRSYMAMDEEGDIYLTCYTESANYPVTDGTYDTTYNGIGDIAVTLLDSSLTRVIASTYVGAGRNDWPYAIGCSPSGVYVTGHTDSTGFPASENAYDEGYNGGTDVFVCALDRDLRTLIGATFLGGSGFDNTCSLLIEPSRDVVVAGHTASRNFPTTINAYSEDYGGGDRDIFVSRLSPDLSNLKRSTLLGGSDSDIQPLLALLPDGAIALTGETRSPDFPFTDGLFKGGESDYALCVLDPTLSELRYSLSVGGSGRDGFGGIASEEEYVVIAGRTTSADLGVQETGYDPSHNGGLDVFVIKLPTSAMEGTPQETGPPSSESQPPTPTLSGGTGGIPGFPLLSVVIGLIAASILISFKGKVTRA